ncbi:MAG: sensor domain-containing diguanylate cyclase [Elusimicrobia bacterium]|nr:sensor domain-containing diguanylate cyclase [Elusimicrobiota bacterium]
MEISSKKKQAIKELFQTVIIPLFVGASFFIWVYELIASSYDKTRVFPLSVIMLILFYFLSGPVYAGVLLGFITTVSFMIIVITSGAATSLILLFQTLWLWSMFAVFGFYRISLQKHHNRILVEEEIMSTDLDLLKNKIEENARHLSDLKTRLSNYKYLEEMTIPLSSTMHEEKIIPLVTELASKFIGRGKWKIRKGFHLDTFATYINKYKVALLIENVSTDNRFVIENPSFRSLIAVPLEVNSEFWGILEGTSSKENIFDEGDLRLLSILGGISSIALTNAQLYKKTQELAITDSLTGLFVQSYFKERLLQELVRSRRYKLPLSIALIDIDHFKNINDTYGHNIGDEVLKHISAVMHKRLRDTDFLSRYGGEEFGIIMLQTNNKEAYKVAEDIRKNIQKEKFHYINKNEEPIVLEITASVGLAVYNENVKTDAEFINIADKALYNAKSKGRNRTEIIEF